MVVLQYPKTTSLTKSWEERLKKLIIAYSTEEIANLQQVVILENNKRYEGKEAVEEFIKSLEKFMQDWRTPRCGV